jgi:hypothetical protein
MHSMSSLNRNRKASADVAVLAAPVVRAALAAVGLEVVGAGAA